VTAYTFLQDLLQRALQRLLDAEFEQSIGAGAYERTEGRRGYRNGSYGRTLTTRAGQVELKVPRDRAGLFSPALFRAFERHERAFQLVLAEMVLQGVSTRKVSNVVEILCGEGLSKSTVSLLASEVMKEVSGWLARPLAEEMPIVMFDATYVKVREEGRVVSRAVLVALAIHEDGKREVIGVKVADRESTALWGDFIRGLSERGLKRVLWAISDQHEGLVQAIQTHLQGSAWQRCQVHFMRNFISRLSRREDNRWIARLKDLFAAPDIEEARRRLRQLIEDLHKSGKEALAEWVEEGIEDCLNVFQLPAHLKEEMFEHERPRALESRD